MLTHVIAFVAGGLTAHLWVATFKMIMNRLRGEIVDAIDGE